MEMIQWMVQASSRSWSGSSDICMNSVRGQPAVFHTLTRILEYFPSSHIVIVAPEFDSDGTLLDLACMFHGKVDVYFGHNESPLKRMVAAHRKFFLYDCFIRINALNMFFQPEHMQQLWDLGIDNAFDCVKFPDDYPIQFTADFYRCAVLELLALELPSDSVFHIHPKYMLMRSDSHKVCVYKPSMIADNILTVARKDAKELYIEPRDNISSKRIAIADTLGFHYTMALPSIKPKFKVLDIACGGSFGPLILSQKAALVIGADIDAECIAAAKTATRANQRVSFSREDVTSTNFKEASFDLITSFETIEHVDEQKYLEELYRILKPGGGC